MESEIGQPNAVESCRGQGDCPGMDATGETVLELPERINAIWKSQDGDHCVTIRGHLGVGPDGRQYVSVLDTETGLPLDELEF